MIFRKTDIAGAYVIDPEPRTDERGSFSRIFCAREFAREGIIPFAPAQENRSFTRYKGTIRGLHYQLPPAAEDKLIQCISGAIYDVVLDLRRESPTFKKWVGFELNEENQKMMFVPKGCAHGFQSLCDGSVVHYLVSEFYAPDKEHGIRWSDPSFGIDWPIMNNVIVSEKDRNWPLQYE